MHEAFTVRDVVFEGGVAVGVTGHGPSGTAVTAAARVVIGADGWNSFVARAVGADRHHEKPVLQNAFYTFWSGLPTDPNCDVQHATDFRSSGGRRRLPGPCTCPSPAGPVSSA